jgi:hypothetical protein
MADAQDTSTKPADAASHDLLGEAMGWSCVALVAVVTISIAVDVVHAISNWKEKA